MTLTSTTLKVQYSGNGANASFPVTYVFWETSDLRVVLTDDSTGAETEWIEGTHYEVTGGGGATGMVTAKTSPTDYRPGVGKTLTILSNRADTQPTSLPLGGPFPSTSVEQALDQLARLVQQLAEEVDRCLKLPASSSTALVASTELPRVDNRAGGFLSFDSSGGVTVSSGQPADADVRYWPVVIDNDDVVISLGDPRRTIYAPHAMTLRAGKAGVKAYCVATSVSGAIAIDVELNGASIFSSPLTIDQGDYHSDDAIAECILSTSSIAANDKIEFIVTGAGSDAEGLTVLLIGDV